MTETQDVCEVKAGLTRSREGGQAPLLLCLGLLYTGQDCLLPRPQSKEGPRRGRWGAHVPRARRRSAWVPEVPTVLAQVRGPLQADQREGHSWYKQGIPGMGCGRCSRVTLSLKLTAPL